MNVLVVGSGGREHTLVWKLHASPSVQKLHAVPGSSAIGLLAECHGGEVSDPSTLADLAESLKADLTVVGPELPLVQGVVDEFEARGLKIVGPTRAAAELEGSKVFAKEFMRRHGIPTADFEVCRDATAAYTALCAVEWPCVIKADGLAAGKGVRIVEDPDSATATVDEYMKDKVLGEAGNRILIEECLEGEELSFIVLTDGETILPFPPSQDHKRVFDDDQGPNTGGMGAYSDDAMADEGLRRQILDHIVRPTLEGLKAEGRPYKGFLYVGLMLTADGPKVLEYNCRMGDPECQPLLVRLESDLAEALAKTAEGKLAGTELRWTTDPAACVVLASGGYPGSYEKGKEITGLEQAAAVEGVTVFHAGTKLEGDRWLTAGGRVLGVAGRGATLQEALDRAYRAAEQIQFEGRHFRRDIGARGLRRIHT